MKRIFNRLGNSKLLLILAIILQILIIILIINPFSIIAQNELNGITSQVVSLSQDPDFRNASLLKITNAESFKKQYFLSDKYSELKDNDYALLVNDKLIIYRKDENKIVFKGVAPSSMLDSTRLALIISQKVKDKKLIKDSEIPSIKFYEEEVDQKKYTDYSATLKNGDVLASFAENKIIVIYNIQSDSIEKSLKFSIY